MPKMLPTNKDELEEAYDVVELAADYNRLVRKYRRVRRVLKSKEQAWTLQVSLPLEVFICLTDIPWLVAEYRALRSEFDTCRGERAAAEDAYTLAKEQRDRNEIHGRDLKHENGVLRKAIIADVFPFLLLVQDKEEYPSDEAYALRVKLQRLLGITKDWRDDIRLKPSTDK